MGIRSWFAFVVVVEGFLVVPGVGIFGVNNGTTYLRAMYWTFDYFYFGIVNSRSCICKGDVWRDESNLCQDASSWYWPGSDVHIRNDLGELYWIESRNYWECDCLMEQHISYLDRSALMNSQSPALFAVWHNLERWNVRIDMWQQFWVSVQTRWTVECEENSLLRVTIGVLRYSPVASNWIQLVKYVEALKRSEKNRRRWITYGESQSRNLHRLRWQHY